MTLDDGPRVKRRRTTQLSTRKLPQQSRSVGLVNAILEAAAQVLEREGARRFTTARVAERAGVSVGSVYQYFPNKAAILFRLQRDEWQQTTQLLCDILNDVTKPPLWRLRTLVHAFIQSECDEAGMRMALHEAAPSYRDTAEAKQARQSANRAVQIFVQEMLPDTSKAACALAADLLMTTLSMVGKQFSASPRTPREIKAYADAMADMFCGYLRGTADRLDG